MDRADALGQLAIAQVGRFATVTSDGRPHLVPVTFALDGDTVVHMIDGKPKTTQRLKRLVNLESRPYASLLVDHYEARWSRLWWVRVDGMVQVVEDGERWEAARRALVEKYVQYRESPPSGPAILLSIDNLNFWSST